MIVVKIKDGVISHFAARAPEWFFAFALINVGEAMAGPGDTFSTSHSYDGMAAIATECVWGWSMIVLGVARFAVLAVNGNIECFRPFASGTRMMLSFLTALVWFTIALGMVYANPIGTGARAYGSLLIGEVYTTWVVSGEAAHAFWPWYRMRKLSDGRP